MDNIFYGHAPEVNGLFLLNHEVFLAPETISTAHYPGYTKIGTSSKLVDLVISGRFRGL